MGERKREGKDWWRGGTMIRNSPFLRPFNIARAGNLNHSWLSVWAVGLCGGGVEQAQRGRSWKKSGLGAKSRGRLNL